MLKSFGIALGLIFVTACGSTVISKNSYKGDGKNYICTLPDGKQEERKFIDISSFPDCTEVSESISNADTAPKTHSEEHEAPTSPGAVYLPQPIQN